MKKTSIIASFALAYCTVCKGQNDPALELSLVPVLGFNLSMPVISPQSSKDNFTYTRGNMVPKHYFGGIGVQLQLWDDWQATLKVAQTGYSYSFKFEYPLQTPFQKTIGNKQSSAIVNVIDFTTEKKIASTGSIRIARQNVKLSIQALVGIRYATIPKIERTDTFRALPSLTMNSIEVLDSMKNTRFNGGSLLVGLNAQLHLNEHRSIKLGAMYSYAPNPLFEYRTNVSYYVGRAYYNDRFTTLAGKHELLLYVEYPISIWKKNSN